ncbi:MAG: sodium:solute symporter family protein [Myxococcota bacterium]
MIDLLIVVLHVTAVLAVGLAGSRQDTAQNLQRFALGKKQHTTWLLVGTFGAATIGASATLGQAEWSFREGITYTFVCCVGFPLSDLLLAILIAPRLQRFAGCISCGDIMQRLYGTAGRVFTGIAAVMVCLITVGVQVVALGFISEVLLGVSAQQAALGGMLSITLYSALGGMRSVAFTDIVQLATTAISICLLVVFGWLHIGGWTQFVQALPPTHLQLFPTAASKWQWLPLLFVFCLPVLGPSTLHRLLLAGAAQQAKTTLQINALLRLLLTAAVGLIGLLVCCLFPHITSHHALPVAVNAFLPIGVRGVVIAGLLAAMMSTCDSFLHTASITLVHDVLVPLFVPRMQQQMQVRCARGSMVLLALLSVVLTGDGASVITLLLRSMNFWLPGIFLPLFLGFWGIRSTPRRFLLSACIGFAVCAVWNSFVQPSLPIPGYVPALFVNAVLLLSNGRLTICNI